MVCSSDLELNYIINKLFGTEIFIACESDGSLFQNTGNFSKTT